MNKRKLILKIYTLLRLYTIIYRDNGTKMQGVKNAIKKNSTNISRVKSARLENARKAEYGKLLLAKYR